MHWQTEGWWHSTAEIASHSVLIHCLHFKLQMLLDAQHWNCQWISLICYANRKMGLSLLLKIVFTKFFQMRVCKILHANTAQSIITTQETYWPFVAMKLLSEVLESWFDEKIANLPFFSLWSKIPWNQQPVIELIGRIFRDHRQCGKVL